MKENNDPLQSLWQAQSTTRPDIDAIRQRWIQVRRKQRWYFIVDLSTTLLFIVMFAYFYRRLHWFELVWMGSIFSGAIAANFYVGWLRRFSLKASDHTTDNYLHDLQAQLSSNIHISRLTKWTIYILPVLFAIYYAGGYLLNIFEMERFWRKLILSVSVLAVSLPPLWWWANRRMTRFQRELDALKTE